MNTAGSITARLNKIKKDSPVAGRKDENNIFKTNILIKGTSAVKKSNLNSNLNSDSKDEDYSHYKKIRIAKPDKYYKERKKLEP